MITITVKKQDKIIGLRKKGFSYKYISKCTGVSVGSVYKYARNIELTDDQKARLSKRDNSFLFPKRGEKNYRKYKDARYRGGLKRGEQLKPKYSKSDLIAKLVNFKCKKKRLPTKRDFVAEYRAFIRVFGTWNNAVIKAGFNPNPIRFSRRYIANDGHKCDSLSEKIIDDWLFARDIKHKVNYPYPGGVKLTVDFLVDNNWIEFFGLSGELSEYDINKNKKIRIAKDKSLNLIEIYPSDIFPKCKLGKKLDFLLHK